MAEINLKTLTPDTSLPTTGFLFGADSQATASPSVYSTQTVAMTLLGSTSLTGDTLTADAPVLNLAQTWNNGAVTFTGIKLNATSTASAAASLLMDLQVGGSSKVSIQKSGQITGALDANLFSSNAVNINGNLYGSFAVGIGQNFLFNAANSNTGLVISSALPLSWSPNSNQSNYVNLNFVDLLIRRRGAANLQLGNADAASPVAQTLSVQSVVAGTSNAAGAAFTVNGSQGTGTGAGGSIVFQVAPAGGSGTAQNALAPAMVIDSVKTVRLGTGYTVATLPAAGTAGRRTYVTDALAPTFLGTLTGGGAVVCPVFDNGTAWVSA